MAINLDKKYGPFPLKVWLVIGAGGIAVGLYAASKMHNPDQSTVSGDGTAKAPPQVIFNRVIIGLEHVPGADQPVAAIKPDTPAPIMPSNPVAHTPIVAHPILPPQVATTSVDYTAVAPDLWHAFITGNPITPTLTDASNRARASQPASPHIGLDSGGNAYF